MWIIPSHMVIGFEPFLNSWMHFRLVKYYNLSSQAFQENIAIRGKTLKCLPLYLAIFLVSSNPEVDDWMRFFMCLIEKSQVPAFSLVDQLSAESVVASHLGSYSHATSGWNIVKYTADIWDSQIPYWIAWTAIFQLLVGWSTLTARTFKYCICTQVSCFVYHLLDLMVWRQTKCGYRGWSYSDDEKMAC